MGLGRASGLHHHASKLFLNHMHGNFCLSLSLYHNKELQIESAGDNNEAICYQSLPALCLMSRCQEQRAFERSVPSGAAVVPTAGACALEACVRKSLRGSSLSLANELRSGREEWELRYSSGRGEGGVDVEGWWWCKRSNCALFKCALLWLCGFYSYWSRRETLACRLCNSCQMARESNGTSSSCLGPFGRAAEKLCPSCSANTDRGHISGQGLKNKWGREKEKERERVCCCQVCFEL
jgi:hypothetical protein